MGEWDERFEVLKQQLLAKNLSAFVFVAAMLSSFSSFAQMANDGFSPRVVGAYRQVASLQNAVVWQEGPKPVFQTDDTTGRTTCVWNCPEVGETGQARMQEIKVIGEDERRLAAATSYTEVERKRYSGIGRIECPTKAGKIAFGTGFHVRDFKTMVTAAHVFRDPRDGSKLNPSSCSAVFYNSDGTVRETIGIRSVKSRWDNPRLDGDRSNDIAMIKLVTESRTPEQIASLRYAEVTSNIIDVTMVGFHSDMPTAAEKKMMRKLSGSAIQAPSDSLHILLAAKNRTAMNNPENLIVASYDSNHGTSGAPVFNAQGKIIGLNQGATDDIAGQFNAKTSYNLAVRFDESFRSELDVFVAQP